MSGSVSTVLRLLTLNVGSLFEADWDRRRHEVVAWIDRLQPDVVCLQEAWESRDQPNTAGWVAEASAIDWHWAFGGFGIDFLAGDDPRFRFGSAVLSRWPIDEHRVHRLPTAPDPDDAMVTAMGWELLHAATAGLDVFTTHLAPAPAHGRHRRLQVLAMEQIIRDARGNRDALRFDRLREAMPAILCGDFNAEPDSDEMRFLRGLTVLDDRATFMQDAWSVAGDGGPGLTQDWQTHPLAASLNVHRKRIDHILVGDPFRRAGDAGRILHCEIVADHPITGIQASDHCGLIADIVWPSRPH